MKITFEKKKTDNDHLVIVYNRNFKNYKAQQILPEENQILKSAVARDNKLNEAIETFHFRHKNDIKSLTIVKVDFSGNPDEFSKTEAYGGKLFSFLERKGFSKILMMFIHLSENKELASSLLNGFSLKSYRFDKYKVKTKKKVNIQTLKILDLNNDISKNQRDILTNGKAVKGVFLTRDLVSEPANILFPQKFVEICNVLKKVGVSVEVFDEKKLRSLGMLALLGVAQGSVKPARVMIMRWNGSNDKKQPPIAFIGKGVTFDTGGISIKPSGGMEDMKWDMGGAGVVAGLMYTLALRKSKANVLGAVGLVENMPDGNAQRPGDIVKSMSGQTIEVLNTDAEGRLVLADVLWYIKEKFKPKLMVDLATLTGAIIVALGDRYAGLFSNNEDLSEKLLKSSRITRELIWRLPLDKEFDKLLNCNVADMKNITGTRGAGSITAAQFLKRFVGDVPWAHLDIAGVTWSKKGTDLSRPGGTGFGVRLLDHFVKQNYG
ncbi:MAG: leucyl aminopeptidase [Pelagibacteraceae bacterium TMED65]|nr:leucyl aminopeptidase [Rickettsiales bacterium]OUU51403.1 MAG: leucyl aminopeptidase [Pelagibacteraceae bacterium TMED65]